MRLRVADDRDAAAVGLDDRALGYRVGRTVGALDLHLRPQAFEQRTGGGLAEARDEVHAIQCGQDLHALLDETGFLSALLGILSKTGLEGVAGFLIGVPEPAQAGDERADEPGDGEGPIGAGDGHKGVDQ